MAVSVIKISGAFGRKHSCLLIALLIYAYLMSATTLAFMISTFFSKSLTASLATMLFNFVLYFSRKLIYQAQMSNLLIRVSCMLFSTITFSLGIIELLIHFPFKGLTILDCFDFNAPDHSMGVYFFFLIFDTFLYFILTIIFDKFGKMWCNQIRSTCDMIQFECYKMYTCIKWRFKRLLCCCNSNYGRKRGESKMLLTLKKENNFKTNIEDNTLSFMMSTLIETVSPEMRSNIVAVRAINISKNDNFNKLSRKTYGKETIRNAVVENLSLEVYDGEVFALLGHNNSGKTTIVNMLSGIIPVSTGNVFIYDNEITVHNASVLNLVSVCPQESIFFEELTCMEHIIFFAGLRGIDIREGLKTVKEGIRYYEKTLLVKKELEEKRHEIATLLINSGGKVAQEKFSKILEAENKFSCYGLSLFMDETTEKTIMLHTLSMPSSVVYTWNDILCLIEEAGLTHQIFFTPRCLSNGMKRRLWLVIALLRNPKVLILDEPTSGMNSMERQQIWKIIQKERKSGRCIILTTNNMEEADILADRKAMLLSGRICCLGTSDFLKYKFNINYSLEVIADAHTNKNREKYIFEYLLPFIQSIIPEASYDYQKSEKVQHRGPILKSSVFDYNKTYSVFTLPITSINTFSLFFNELEANKNKLNIWTYRVSLATLEDVFYKIGSLHIIKSESLYPCLPKKTFRHNSIDGMFSQNNVYQTDQSSYEEKIDNSNQWKVENETNFNSTLEIPITSNLQGKATTAKHSNPWDYITSYLDFVYQKKKSQLFLLWENVKAISRLRCLQIICNKTLFHIDVILPILVLIGSFFINEENPGYLNSFIFQEKPIPVLLDQYGFFLQSSIPFHIDSQLLETEKRRVYEFLSFFPDEFQKKIIEVGSYEAKVTAGNNNKNKIFPYDITNIFSKDEVLIRYKKDNTNLVYDKHLLPLHPAIKFTNLNGQSLRNFFYQTRRNISRDNDYVFGLNFEAIGTEALPASTHYTWDLNNEFTIRLFYNTGFPHILPNFVSLLSDVILKWQLNVISGVASVTNENDSLTKTPNPSNIKLTELAARETWKKLKEREKFGFTFHTKSLPLPIYTPVYMTSMTYGVYVILSVVLTILPSRFGTQIMVEKIQGTKHAMIVMGLPIAHYWFGNFAINYVAMLFGNFLMSLCIAYFFSLFRSYILVPILICSLFYNAAVLLYAYFLSHYFSSIKSYTNALQLSTFILSLAPAYFVSIFADITDSDAHWNSLMKIIHLVASFLLPQYNPIGSLLGCAIIEEKFKRREQKPKLTDFFLFEHLPMWNVIGSATQAVVLYSAIIWVDYVTYNFKKSNKKNRKLLNQYYDKKDYLKRKYANTLGENQSFFPEYLQNQKDPGVVFEEEECQILSDAVLHNNVQNKSIVEKDSFPKGSNLIRNDNNSCINIFPLVLMHNIHYLIPAKSKKQHFIVPVQGVSLRIYRGEIMGIVGPKGAGKTTCLNLLCCHPTTAAPTWGRAFIGGYDVYKHTTKISTQLGVCPQHETLWHDISVRENLEILSRIKLLPKEKIETFVDDYIHIWGLKDYEHMRLGDCNIGNQRLLSVAVAFIGNSEIVILDEPFRGVDPAGRQKISSYIKKNSQSRCIIVSTQCIEEAETLCTKLGIIVNGELKCIGTSLAIRSGYGSSIRLQILFSCPHQKCSETKILNELEFKWSTFLSSKLAVKLNVLNFTANRVVYSLPLGSNALGQLFHILQSNKEVFRILEFSISQPTLEQIYFSFARHQRPAHTTAELILSE
ncbi:uncharacterized protein LOC128884229 [Hylaeus volcanicus]|uniref:uncharacterized protein LOC128884229 n=1 Tax=Hylaeus volcanicus TaxID=313075 RepID=UPI0023B87C30|nr:uncharacterized protein LOC128884229 [Hylaeus volcanicus]XP_053993440.1 uncharacterized protein LOC128884229 [Hylaeus volcanicus]XP_053993441.1 uncharacterized protein LOC128884229 [Hylaeus volcanicus]